MIREFEINDLKEVMEIWLNENVKAHDFISKKYWEEMYEVVVNILPGAEIFVYLCENRIVGFIGLEKEDIQGLFVDSKMQGKGIGHALVEKAKEKHLTLSLKVYEKNVKAFCFYEKQGFIPHGRSMDEKTDESEITMVWKHS